MIITMKCTIASALLCIAKHYFDKRIKCIDYSDFFRSPRNNRRIFSLYVQLWQRFAASTVLCYLALSRLRIGCDQVSDWPGSSNKM